MVVPFDLCVVVALIFTALVTPYEVAFLGSPDGVDGLFVINRVIDIVFVCDVGASAAQLRSRGAQPHPRAVCA